MYGHQEGKVGRGAGGWWWRGSGGIKKKKKEKWFYLVVLFLYFILSCISVSFHSHLNISEILMQLTIGGFHNIIGSIFLY